MLTSAPLSSMGVVPLTEETRQRLLAVGVFEPDLLGMTEMGAQSLLLLHSREVEDGTPRPKCFAHRYDPTAPLCRGCVFAPGCWHNDQAYMDLLKAGQVQVPPGVPEAALERHLGGHRVRSGVAPPPRRRKAPPQPPKRKKRKAPPPPPSRRKR